MTLKAKLRLVALTPIVLALGVGGLDYFVAQSVEQRVLERHIAQAIIDQSMELTLLTHEYVADPGNRRVNDLLYSKNKALADRLGEASAIPALQDEVLEGIVRSHQRVEGYQRKLAVLVRKEGAESLSHAHAAGMIDGTLTELHAMAAAARTVARRADDAVQQTRSRAARTRLLLLFLLGGGAGFLALRVAWSVSGSLSSLLTATGRLSSGALGHRAPVSGEAEMQELATAFNTMADQFHNVVHLAENVARGDHSRALAPRGPRDELGVALKTMSDRLRAASEDNTDYRWLAGGQAELAAVTRGQRSVAELGRQIVDFLTPCVGAQVAALYVAEDNGHLEFIAGFAFAPPEGRATRFEVGVGVVGQVAAQKQRICLSDVPDGHMPVQSGLGTSPVRELVVQPLLHNEQVCAVLELGSLEPLTERQLRLLDAVSEGLAIQLTVASAHARLGALLDQTRQQAKALAEQQEELQSANEELQAQQEELRQSNEELEEQTARLQASEVRLQAQQEELRQSNEELLDQKRQVEQAHEVLEQRAADLSLASKYKSEFLSNMSHELRTPLNSLLLLSKLLADNRDGNLNPAQVEWAETMHRAGSDLLLLINDILDLSKVEAGKLSVETQEIDVAGLVADMRQSFEHVAEDRGLAFHVEILPGAPGRITSDPHRIGQVLKNLLSNAFKFTAQGEVRLRVAAAGEQALSLAVSDTGPGIAAERQRHIFEAFQQGDGTISRSYGGTGLGLAIGRALAELLGGTLQLESEEGRGSTFTLVLPVGLAEGASVLRAPPPLPATPPAAPVVSKPVAEVAASSRPYVLVIEDDPVFAGVLVDQIKRQGLHAVAVGTGAEGLGVMDRELPLGVLLDWGLPDISGEDLLDAVQAKARGRSVPVHVISGADVQEPARAGGAVTVLRKPVSEAQIANLLADLAVGAGRSRVLIVEDTPDQRAAIHAFLGDVNAELVTASTGAEALQRLEEGAFACVIVDIGLPDMSGFELLERMPRGDERVVVYTGRELTEDEEARTRRRSDSIILKGATPPSRLLEDVKLFLRQVGRRDTERRIPTLIPEVEIQGKTVLVVDDDIRNVFALSASLEAVGLNVAIARNGLEGVGYLEANPSVDIVLMDVMMPVMDGYEAMRRIRSELKMTQLPIIAITAKAMKGDAERCLDAGANEYLAKPIDLDRLLSMIRVWLAARPRA